MNASTLSWLSRLWAWGSSTKGRGQLRREIRCSRDPGDCRSMVEQVLFSRILPNGLTNPSAGTLHVESSNRLKLSPVIRSRSMMFSRLWLWSTIAIARNTPRSCMPLSVRARSRLISPPRPSMTQVADPNSDFKLAEQKKEITNQIESLPKPSPERRKRLLGSSRRAVPRQLQGVLGCGLLHDLRQAAQPDTNLFNRRCLTRVGKSTAT